MDQLLDRIVSSWQLLVPVIMFAVAYLIQIIHYLFIYSSIFRANKSKVLHSSDEPVSVIICARNEAENLRKNLPAILDQDYANYEVIVVNDCSTDHSEDVLIALTEQYKHLRFTTIEKDHKFTHGKKLAVTVGVKAAKNEWLLFTDADCQPDSKYWVRQMQENFTPDASIVLGYGGFNRRRSLFNNFIRFDNLFIGLQYISLALTGIPYMGVGRNLAYRKSLFFKNRGFARHYHIPSGDDDLFVNETATRHNVRIEVRPGTITRSETKHTVSEWIVQKKRHLRTGFHYSLKTKIVLSLEAASRMLFYLLFLLLLVFVPYLYVLILPLFFFRMVLQLIMYKKCMRFFGEKNLLLPSLLYDFIIPFINLIFVIANLYHSEENTWK